MESNAMVELVARDGRTFAFPRGPRTALLLIDMQRDFLDPGGYSGVGGEDVASTRAIIPRVRAVLDAARAAGLTIVHTREGHEPDLSDLHPAKAFRSKAAGAEIGANGPLGRLLVRGEYGHDFVDELQPLPDEHVFDKPGFGAFYGTQLGPTLQRLGVTHLAFTGVTTQCCVHSTLREAVDRGYWCLLLEDCTAAFDPAVQRAAVDMVETEGGLFGWVSTGAGLVQRLRAAVPPPGLPLHV
jgi:nicotinamidase-related amidase